MTDEQKMRTRAAKKAAALADFLAFLLKAGVEPGDVTANNPAVVAAAWNAVEGVGLFKSTSALPLLNPAQAEVYSAEHKGCKVYAIDADRAMVVDADGREVRLYKGEPMNVTDVPDAAYSDLPRLRRTRTPADPLGRILRSVGTLVTAGRAEVKRHRAAEKAEQKAAKAEKAEQKAAKAEKGKRGKNKAPIA